MFCRQCGTRNEVGSKFCEACGGKLGVLKQGRSARHLRVLEDGNVDDTVLVSQDENDYDSEVLFQNENYRTSDYSPGHQGYNDQNNAYGYNAYTGNAYSGGSGKKRRNPLVIVVGVLLLVIILLVGWIFMGEQNIRAFNDAMDEGNRYLLTEDLEQAEAQFLRAIEIRPREIEPYLQLADIYMTLGEPEEAIAILEQGLEAVPESDRPALEEALDEIYETIGEERPVVGEVAEDARPEAPEEIAPFYLALIAFHEFLSNPQSMVFYPWPESEGHDLSWELHTLLHAELIDLRGDGVPQLLIVPPRVEEMWWSRAPIIIFEYSEGQMEVIYQGLIWGEGGGWGYYELAFTIEGKTYLVKSDGSIHVHNQANNILDRVVRSYLTLDEEELVPVLTTIRYVSYREISEEQEWVETIEYAYVNNHSVSEADFERAPYEHLAVIERREVLCFFEDSDGAQPLLLYIESRLEVAGIDLSEHIADAAAAEPEQEEEQRETENIGNPFNLDVWGSNNALRIESSGVTIDAPIPSRADLQDRGYRFVLFGEGSGGWWYRVDVQIGNDNTTLDAINRYINWVRNRDCTIEMSHETHVLGDLRLATMDVRRYNDEGREMMNATYVISFEHEGQVVVAHINFAGNFNDARKEPFFRAYGIDRFIRAGLL